METKNYDVIVIGAGPAGMTAAIYAARSEMKTLIVERGIYGGMMQKTEEIENYPGFKTILGPQLSEEMYQHAIHFGAEYAYGDIRSIEEEGSYKILTVGKNQYKTKAVIIATGADYRKLGVLGEEEFSGKGVSYCAICDGAFFKHKELVVIGGGDSAVEEANYLTRFAEKVTIIHRRDKLRAQPILQKRVMENPKINILWDTVVQEIVGDTKVKAVKIEHTVTGEIIEYLCDGAFIYVGMDPLSKPFKTLGITNPTGCIPTNEKMETTVPGIFAAGDIREKSLRQVITAAGDGSVAAQSAQHYVEWLDENTKEEKTFT